MALFILDGVKLPEIPVLLINVCLCVCVLFFFSSLLVLPDLSEEDGLH